MMLFAGLAVYTSLVGHEWTIPAVRLIVDGGLLAIALFSLAIRLPLTLQYARESAPKEVWSSPEFYAVNQNITAVWAAAFAVLVAADAAMIYLPEIPRRVDIIATVLALVGAYKFTVRATERAQEGA